MSGYGKLSIFPRHWRDTNAFKNRDKKWSHKLWNYTEWEECIEEVREEIKSKKS